MLDRAEMDAQRGPTDSGPQPDGEAIQAGSDFADSAKKPPRLTVLIVDDEPLIRWSLQRGLSRRGHAVVEAKTAAEALALVTADPHRFAVTILDYRLPDSQDLSLLRDVRRIAPDIAVVMMTAYGDEDMRNGALAIGA